MHISIMIKSYRSKRRRIQEELNLYDTCNSSPELHNIEHENLNSSKTISFIEKLPPDYNKKNITILSSIILPSTTQQQSITTNNVIEQDEINMQECFDNDLTNWAICSNITHNSFNALLNVLRKHSCFKELPKDCRTLLKVKSNAAINVRDIEPSGIYYHFGLENGIKQCSNNLNSCEDIKIVVGIDGLPIAKSSLSQLWPILGYVRPFNNNVFIIGIYHGYEKPKDSNSFLNDFVIEAKTIVNQGIVVNGKLKKVSIDAICCDAPAKSFVLKIKGHSGFFSCTRCKQEGEYLQKRISFPFQEISSKRNHNDYINMSHEEYHISDTVSQLVEIKGIDTVYSFPLDYLHLTCLGIMKKLINMWVSNGPLSVRLPSKKVNEISSYLLDLKKYVPCDFPRKPRALSEVPRWKGTEFRFFLLYVGPIVLKNVLNDDCFKHFMSLNIAFIILLSPNLGKYIDFARKLLIYFVQSFSKIYGIHLLSHNVHGLLHVCDDYDRYGPLDNCSTFPFENFMSQLKKMLRKNEKPLQQIVNRYEEKLKNKKVEEINRSKSDQNKLNVLHNNGPILNDINNQHQYKSLQIGSSAVINISNKADCFVMTKNSEIIKVVNIIHSSSTNKTQILGHRFNNKEPLYLKPLKSSILDIYSVGNLSSLKCWDVSDIHKKMIVFSFKNKQIAMPIIHSNCI